MEKTRKDKNGFTLHGKRTMVIGSVLAVAGILALTLLTTSYYPAIGQTPVTIVSTYTRYTAAPQPPTIGAATAANITVGGSPGSAAIDSSTDLLYVTNGQSLSVISAATDKVVGNITLSEGASLVAVNSQTGTIYVNSVSCPPCSASVIAVNGTTGKQIASVDLGVYVDGMMVNPGTNMVYAISADNGMLYAINGTTNSLASKVALPGAVFSLAFDAKTDVAYVAACNTGFTTGFSASSSSTLASSTSATSSSASLAPSSSSTETLFATTGQGTSPTPSLACGIDLYAINGSSLSVTNMGQMDVAGAPKAMIVNPVTDTVYATSVSSLVSINGTTGAETVTQLSAFTMSCYGLTADTLDNYVFVSCAPNAELPSLFVINGNNYQILNSFTNSGSPAGMVFDETFGSAFLVNQNGYVLQLLSTYTPLP